MFTSQDLISLAQFFMPHDQKDWIDAMRAEMFEMTVEEERRRFAFGCLKSALNAVIYSRKGLSYIARGSGAFFISAVSLLGIWEWNTSTTPEDYMALSKLITGVCLFYCLAAILLLTSLKSLKVYALSGLGLAVTAWVYCVAIRPEYEAMPLEFLIALSFEMSVFMAMLFGASLFLNGLYSPKMKLAERAEYSRKK